jgi:hypothetical protein
VKTLRLTNQSYIVQAVVLSEVIDSLLRIAEQNDVLYPISYLYEVMDIRDMLKYPDTIENAQKMVERLSFINNHVSQMIYKKIENK